MGEGRGRVLVVDDEPVVLRGYARLLQARGWQADAEERATAALERLKTTEYDAVLSDVTMPEMDGLAFLRAVRALDLDVPVILMSARGDLDVARHAMEFGAFSYLIKPFPATELEGVLERATKLHEIARLKRFSLEEAASYRKLLGDRAALETRFAAALERIHIAFQPIVSWAERRVFGFEALLRSGEPTLGNPLALLDAAERLDRVHDLGRIVRQAVAEAAAGAPEGAMLFVNLHASDLQDDELFSPDAPLTRMASRVVLELTERASLEEVEDPRGRISALKELGFQIAVDDLGAGYAGLSSFTQLEPHIAKLDMSLIRGIAGHERAQRVVQSMTKLCAELGMLVVAEGVETAAERDVLVGMSCPLLQGYFYSRPTPTFTVPDFGE